MSTAPYREATVLVRWDAPAGMTDKELEDYALFIQGAFRESAGAAVCCDLDRLAVEIIFTVEVPKEVEGSREASSQVADQRRADTQLNERLRWAQAVLASPARAAVEASGMSDEELATLREAFEVLK